MLAFLVATILFTATEGYPQCEFLRQAPVEFRIEERRVDAEARPRVLVLRPIEFPRLETPAFADLLYEAIVSEAEAAGLQVVTNVSLPTGKPGDVFDWSAIVFLADEHRADSVLHARYQVQCLPKLLTRATVWRGAKYLSINCILNLAIAPLWILGLPIRGFCYDELPPLPESNWSCTATLVLSLFDGGTGVLHATASERGAHPEIVARRALARIVVQK